MFNNVFKWYPVFSTNSTLSAQWPVERVYAPGMLRAGLWKMASQARSYQTVIAQTKDRTMTRSASWTNAQVRTRPFYNRNSIKRVGHN